jgi:hypothetical protein
MRQLSPPRIGRWLLVVLLWSLAGHRLAAQAPEGDLPVRDSGVGYIDSAIPGNVLRIRTDVDFDNQNPARGAFFYARPGNPGLPLPERSVNDQEVSSYLEVLIGERCSVFANVPVRFLQPEVNANASGLGDVDAGIKVAVIQNEDGIWSFQFRTYAPSGDPHTGLGNGHVSLEPALLCFIPLGDRAALDGELRYWLPLGETGFASQVVRYGIGLECRIWDGDSFRVTTVLETVGWTFFGGKDAFALPDGVAAVNSATWQTIVNIKPGLRIGVGAHFDVYGGYAVPVTGDKFYEQGVRFEVRFVF